MLYQCFQALKIYGKEPEAFDSMVAMHLLVLSDYTLEQIQNAFKFYLKTNNEFPAPSDIAQIIERNGKPPFDKAVYVSVSRKPPEERSSEEWAYMRDYQAFIISGDY